MMPPARLPVVLIRPPAPPPGPPDIPMANVVGVLRDYRDSGRDDLFEDHFLWLMMNFRFGDAGAFLIPQDPPDGGKEAL